MPTSTIGKEQELGRGAQALKRICGQGDPGDSLPVRMEITDAPRGYRRAMASRVTEDVFRAIEPHFPVLLRRAPEHEMGWAQLVDELDLIVAMGDVRDPASAVYVYSLQVAEPRDASARADEATLKSLAPSEWLVELRNGYVSHGILYGLHAPQRGMILMTLLRPASRVRVTLKPPWSAQKVECVVLLPGQASSENTRSAKSSSLTPA